jgi:hypothetical protein
MAEACSRNGRDEKFVKRLQTDDSTETGCLEDPGLDGKIPLKWTVKK